VQKIANRLRFDKVTESLKVGTFLRHSVVVVVVVTIIMMMMIIMIIILIIRTFVSTCTQCQQSD